MSETAIQPLRPVTFKDEGFAGLVTRTLKSKKGAAPLPITFYQPLITSLQIVVDMFTVMLSYGLGYLLVKAFGPKFGFSSMGIGGVETILFPLAVTLITLIVGFQVNGLYHPHRSILNIRELEVLLKTCFISCGITLSVMFLAENSFFSRELFATTWIVLIGLMFVQRSFFFQFQNHLRSAGVVQTTALIYGAGEVGQKLLQKLKQSPKLGYHVAGFVDDNSNLRGVEVSDVPVLGGFVELKNIISQAGASKLFIALPQVPQKVVEEILRTCRAAKCDFQIVPSLYDIVIQRVKLTEVDGIPLIGVSEPKYSWRTMVAKRVTDFILAVLLLVILSPLLIVFAALVKMSSKGPILFRQKRVGKNGKKFLFYKFRSMYVDAPVYAETPSDSKDSRITKIGKFLRRTSLDELPQLWNVIKGDMSLVGPRPEMPFIVSQYNELQRQRLNVRPGITGLWQISPDRKLAIHQNMDYDIYYINNQSFLLDIAIMARTAFSCIKGVGAY